MADKPKLTSTETSKLPSPAPTFYSERAKELIAAIDRFTQGVPDFDAPQVSKEFVNRKRQVPPEFISHALSALKVDAELQGVPALKAGEVFLKKQYVEAFHPVIRHLVATLAGVRFSVAAAEAQIAGHAQQIYGVAKALARDREMPTPLTMHVEHMQRALRAARRKKSARTDDEATSEE